MQKLFGTVVPIVTPLTEDDQIDVQSLKNLVDHCIDNGLQCLYPCGTTGEMMYLTVAERKLVAEVVLEHTNKRVPVFVQVGAWNLADTIELAKHAVAKGADGIGVVYSAKILGRPLKGRAPGVDFAQGLMTRMAHTGQALFLLGAKPGVAEAAAENLRKAYPGLNICGTHDGYFKEDGPVIDAIRAAKADVVFVCLGAPKQEFWMTENGPKTGAKLAVGLGGCLDVFAGNVQRAPEVWQKAGLEWLYRLIKEPSRIGRMAKLPLVLVDAFGARLGGK